MKDYIVKGHTFYRGNVDNSIYKTIITMVVKAKSVTNACDIALHISPTMIISSATECD